ncbi:unnamed protein product, partial [Rotaria magnacalcarata]
MYLIGKDHLPL